LYGCGVDDRVYVVERADDGSCAVRFGDGAIGARLPSGAQVTADYRSGLGTAGNVGAGTLRLPLTRPTGLVSVFNPVAADGGNDPETLDEARLNAPSTVRTLERIVSLQDFVDQAMENALVAKAAAVWTPLGAARGVSLTVAGPAGAMLGSDQLNELRADLDSRRDANVQLQIQGYKPVALSISVRILASDPTLRRQDVASSVQAALLDAFSFDALSFGQPVRLSEVFVAAQNATGVIGVEVERFTLADPLILYLYWLTPDPVQHRINLDPDQLATLSADGLTVVSS
ncbi:MAG: baseplate J/gp47 family protein, partial [Trebonia sp.]